MLPNFVRSGPRPGRRATRSSPVAVGLPQVPLWFICTRSHWRRCKRGGAILPAGTHRRVSVGLPVALHAAVGAKALSMFGACRADLVALALDPRKLPGLGPETIVRVGLDDLGAVTMWIDVVGLSFEAASAMEPLRPLEDEAGYFPPALETPADRERRQSRDGLRRTK